MRRRAVHRLTVAEVRSITKPGRHRDGAGLFLNVDTSGAKRWGLIFETSGRRHELGGIGRYPDVTLAEAREKASVIRRRIRLGIDPSPVSAKRKPTGGHFSRGREHGDRNAFAELEQQQARGPVEIDS